MNSFKFPQKHVIKVIIITASIAVFCIALWVRDSAQQELVNEKGNLQQQQFMNNTAAESAALLEQYLHQYRDFQQQGIIGNPNRLQWLESVQHNVNEYRIPKLNFILSATELTTDANPLYHNMELETKATLMKVTFTLLHEGDFYHFFNQLQQDAKGVFNAEECTIRRNEHEGEELTVQKLEGAFAGSCDLRWYSIADVTRSWEVPAP